MRLESDNKNIPIWEKAMLTKQEAALYSHIGSSKLPICFICWKEKADKTQGI